MSKRKARDGKIIPLPKASGQGGQPASVGPANPVKDRIAKKTLLAGGFGTGEMDRTAGMMLDGLNSSVPNYAPGFVMESYRNSYASGLGYKSGVYDIPTFITLMNSKNGGIIQWPSCLQERYSWFRWYARSDGIVGRALDLLADLPLSKISLHIPKHVPEAMREEVKELFEDQTRQLELFKRCGELLYERNSIGNVFVFVQWDEENMRWKRIQMLPPEEVFVFEIPFSEEKRIEYRPRKLIQMIQGSTSSSAFQGLDDEIIKNVPKEIVDSITNEGCILLDSDPMNGSFCEHIVRRKSQYLDLSSSLLDRVLVPLQLKDFYKFTQLALASRNMSPKYMVIAPQCTPAELDDLRAQWDMSYLDPDFSIVANYDFHVDKVDSRDRLLDIASEIERLDNEIYSALGVTKELLTGEGSYSGSKTTVEIIHTMFLREREILVDFIENRLFIPICEKRGWFTIGKNNIKKYWCPKVGFNRLTIRDNQEVFESLFQLYQKGSLPVEIIYELFNLDTTEIDAKLYQDLFTIRDSTFNEFVRGVLSEAGRGFFENSDIGEKLGKYLNLKYSKPQEDGGGMGGMGGMGAGQPPPEGGQPPQEEDQSQELSDLVSQAFGDNAQPAPEQGEPQAEPSAPMSESSPQAPESSVLAPQTEPKGPEQTSFNKEDMDKRAEEVASELPFDASAEDIISKIISKEKSWNSLTDYERDLVIDDAISALPENATDEDIMKQIILKTGGI